MAEDSLNTDESFSLLPDDGEGYTDTDGAGDVPEKKLKALKQKLAVCLTEKEGYLLGWQRERADFANFKKEASESERRRAEIAQEKLIEDIIPVLDSFSMAFANKTVWESVDKDWRTGVEYIHQQLSSALSAYGLEPFSDLGNAYDPARHIAVDTQEVADEKDDQTVCAVIQNGYTLKGKVLRPARVVVGSLKEAQ
jgi:molecular chaperone GrpE